MTPQAAAADTGAALRIARLQLGEPNHVQALLALLDEYAASPEGGGAALPQDTLNTLPAALAARPHYIGWLAFEGEQPVGLINAFEGLSTFKARPLLNIHDIAVTRTHQGRGIGRALLQAAEAHARATGCCKLTLEVLHGNRRAIRLYGKFGFAAYELDPAMGHAIFFEKPLS